MPQGRRPGTPRGPPVVSLLSTTATTVFGVMAHGTKGRRCRVRSKERPGVAVSERSDDRGRGLSQGTGLRHFAPATRPPVFRLSIVEIGVRNAPRHGMVVGVIHGVSVMPARRKNGGDTRRISCPDEGDLSR